MTLAFPYFPGMVWPVNRTVGLFDTTRQIAMSGRQTHFANRTQARYTYEVQIEGLDSNGSWTGLIANTQQTLIGFFNQLLGGALLFNFFDVDDNLVTTGAFGTGDGTTTAFQLARTIGGWSDFVYAPLTAGGSIVVPTGSIPATANATYSAPLIYINGVLKTLTTDYTVTAQGLVTFVSPPAGGAALTWTGQYYWPCYFDDDQLTVSKIARGLWESKKVPSFSTWIY